jgi:hypothetical protein
MDLHAALNLASWLAAGLFLIAPLAADLRERAQRRC